MDSLLHSLDVIFPVCLAGMLLSALGIGACYAIVFLAGGEPSGWAGKVTVIKRWSVNLAWISFACFWLTLLVYLVGSITSHFIHPNQD